MEQQRLPFMAHEADLAGTQAVVSPPETEGRTRRRRSSLGTGVLSPVAWYGGKKALTRWLLRSFPPHEKYVEPFGGAAHVLLRKEPTCPEIYNDLDGRVVNLFRVARDPEMCARLVQILDLTPFSRAEFEAAVRAEPTEDLVEMARRFMVINRMAFGGKGPSTKISESSFAVSTRARRERMADSVAKFRTGVDRLEPVCERLRRVVIECRPADRIIRDHDDIDTLFYVDPPYLPETRSGGRTEAYAHEMTFEEHAALLDLLLTVKGKVVLSGYPAPLYDEKLASWRREEIGVTAQMNNSGGKRTEVIWCNFG